MRLKVTNNSKFWLAWYFFTTFVIFSIFKKSLKIGCFNLMMSLFFVPFFHRIQFVSVSFMSLKLQFQGGDPGDRLLSPRFNFFFAEPTKKIMPPSSRSQVSSRRTLLWKPWRLDKAYLDTRNLHDKVVWRLEFYQTSQRVLIDKIKPKRMKKLVFHGSPKMKLYLLFWL